MIKDILDNPDYIRVMEALQPMEEFGGPDAEQYVKIMLAIAQEVNKRALNALLTITDF